jgi:hypothetical protein
MRLTVEPGTSAAGRASYLIPRRRAPGAAAGRPAGPRPRSAHQARQRRRPDSACSREVPLKGFSHGLLDKQSIDYLEQIMEVPQADISSAYRIVYGGALCDNQATRDHSGGKAQA